VVANEAAHAEVGTHSDDYHINAAPRYMMMPVTISSATEARTKGYNQLREWAGDEK
jgi:hypothetical protein